MHSKMQSKGQLGLLGVLVTAMTTLCGQISAVQKQAAHRWNSGGLSIFNDMQQTFLMCSTRAAFHCVEFAK